MTRCCSQCGSDGHNARTCDQSKAAVGGGGGGGIMLFGVRVGYQDPLRKTVSMNDLSSYEQPNADNTVPKNGDESKGKAVDDSDAGGYVSADDAVQHQNTGGRERKRGKPWTEEEHKLFLLGLQKVGKGDWRGISRKFVKTRTPTQVASHAQKYFIRKNNLNRRRRRSSLFDITTDSVTDESIDGGKEGEDNVARPVQPMNSLPPPEMVNNMRNFAVTPVPLSVPPGFLPMQAQYTLNPMTPYQGNPQLQNPSAMLLYPLSFVPGIAPMNPGQNVGFESAQLSLRLSLSSNQGQSSMRSSSMRDSLKDGDSMISVV